MSPVLPPSGHAEPRTGVPEGHRTPQTPTEALRAPATRPGLAWCWQCIDGHHEPKPRWHSWASDDDAKSAIARRRPDPRHVRCGCLCAAAPKPADLGLTRVVETVHLPEEDQ